jgi:tagatose-6-phosphate ketose/aldose isomerase
MVELGFDKVLLETRRGHWTAREIGQQPQMLRATHDLLVAQEDALNAFVSPITSDPTARIILTGAGTSAFIGDCLAPWLDHRLAAGVEAIATTDIVSAPHLYLARTGPTLLVSFGRSGNSPESVAAVDLANARIPGVRHLIVTCNRDGALAKNARSQDHVIHLPDATHDRGFAMTSSFTSMTYAALAVLSGVHTMTDRIEPIAQAVRATIDHAVPMAAELAKADFDRVAYLGSHIFKGLAREAALKLMELTDGGIVATSESPLGFRHGPKTIVNGRTLVVVFLSNDPLTRKYDRDLLDELRRDGRAARVIAISANDVPGANLLSVPGLASADDVELLFPFIVMPQIFALHASLASGLTPDNPNVAGVVNRVVQGVSIHCLAPA